MKLAHLPAVAALVVSLTAGAALAAQITTGASGNASGGVNATVGGTSVAADTNASASGSANVGTSALGNIDVAKAGTTEESRAQFIATLTADQVADLKARCQAAGVTGASTDVTTLDASAKALCEAALKRM
ncbi:MAG TPA: hypothetical protein VFB16_10225 [Bauldia sp.]|nr:hypothetical protein [Bauldia sp.]